LLFYSPAQNARFWRFLKPPFIVDNEGGHLPRRQTGNLIFPASDFFFVLVICGFYYLFLPIVRINRIRERLCFYNAESVSRFSAKLVLFIIIEDGVFTSNDWLLKIVSVV
jgi:hypothetical protein